MSRRHLLIAGGAAAAAVAVGGCTRGDDRSSQRASAPLKETPGCVDGDDVEETPAQTAGPFFTPNSPERANIADGVDGDTLVITGTIVSSTCEPHAGALLDVWQCDAQGTYDNDGFRLRGHQFADDEGRFRLETIVPGVYPGRTRHIHVRVQPERGRILTTQLYFPGEAQNARDGLYREECELSMADDGTASFRFVV